MTPPANLSTLSPSEKDALIAALLARVKALLVEVEGLRTEIAAMSRCYKLRNNFIYFYDFCSGLRIKYRRYFWRIR